MPSELKKPLLTEKKNIELSKIIGPVGHFIEYFLLFSYEVQGLTTSIFQLRFVLILQMFLPTQY